MTTDFSFLGDTNAAGDWAASPNFLQLLAGMGSQFGQGKSAGEAIGNNTAMMLRQLAMQNAVGGPRNPATQTAPNVKKDVWEQLGEMEPTPKGTPGIDSKTITADGITVKIPSPKNLSTYNSNIPAEAMPSTLEGGVSDQAPFWKALLGQTPYQMY